MRVGMLLGIKISRLLNPVPRSVFMDLVNAFAYIQDPDPPIYLVFGEPEELGFYSGLWPQVQQRLQEYGYEVEIYDKRVSHGLTVDQASKRLDEAQEIFLKRTNKTFRPHQLRSINATIWEPHGAIQMATGSGKTICEAAETYILDRPTTVVVARDVLMSQVAEEFTQILDPKDIGVFGAGDHRPKKVTIGIVNSLWDHPEIFEGRDVVIYDECHMSAAPNSRKMLLNCDAMIRHGYTATYTRSVQDELNLLYSVSGPQLIKVTSTELIEAGWLSRPFISMVKCRWKTASGYSGDQQYEEMIRHFVVHNEERNRIGCQLIYQHYLLGHRCFVFVSRKKHGKILQDMLIREFNISRTSVMYVDGDSNSLKRQTSLQGLSAGTIPIIICTNIFDVGVNVPAADMGIDMTCRLTKIGTLQSLGRILRISPDGIAECYWYSFMDETPPAMKHYANSRYEYLREEPAYRIRVIEPQELFREDREFVPSFV